MDRPCFGIASIDRSRSAIAKMVCEMCCCPIPAVGTAMSLPSTQLCLTCHGWALPGAAFCGSGLHGTVWDHVALSGTALCGLRPHCVAWEIASWLRTLLQRLRSHCMALDHVVWLSTMFQSLGSCCMACNHAAWLRTTSHCLRAPCSAWDCIACCSTSWQGCWCRALCATMHDSTVSETHDGINSPHAILLIHQKPPWLPFLGAQFAFGAPGPLPAPPVPPLPAPTTMHTGLCATAIPCLHLGGTFGALCIWRSPVKPSKLSRSGADVQFPFASPQAKHCLQHYGTQWPLLVHQAGLFMGSSHCAHGSLCLPLLSIRAGCCFTARSAGTRQWLLFVPESSGASPDNGRKRGPAVCRPGRPYLWGEGALQGPHCLGPINSGNPGAEWKEVSEALSPGLLGHAEGSHGTATDRRSWKAPRGSRVGLGWPWGCLWGWLRGWL